MRILTSEFVLPITSDPIFHGAVAIEGSVIEAIGPLTEIVYRYPEAAVEDFSQAAILPGLVNCHSHLEVTALRGSLDAVEHDFYTWLITLTKLRGEVLTEDDIRNTALAGAIEGARAGVTCFGDIGRFGHAGLGALRTAGLRGVLFQETEFSPDDSTADADFAKLRDKIETLRSTATDLVQVGISPHAPYTVSRKLFEKIGRFAKDENLKVTIHSAESQEEDELLRNGSGFFTSVYEKFGVEWKSPHCSSIQYLAQTGILQTQPLLAHCITVSEDDIEIIRETGSSVAHCPKSNAKFGHGYAPFESLMDAGIPVGLGSDSVASNNTCDLFEEARSAAFAARNRSDRARFISAKDVLDAATIGGAKALGLANEIGSLEPGKQADIIVVSLADISQLPVTDVYASLIFASGARDVKMTMVGGAVIYRDGTLTNVDHFEVAEKMREVGRRISIARS